MKSISRTWHNKITREMESVKIYNFGLSEIKYLEQQVEKLCDIQEISNIPGSHKLISGIRKGTAASKSG